MNLLSILFLFLLYISTVDFGIGTRSLSDFAKCASDVNFVQKSNSINQLILEHFYSKIPYLLLGILIQAILLSASLKFILLSRVSFERDTFILMTISLVLSSGGIFLNRVFIALGEIRRSVNTQVIGSVAQLIFVLFSLDENHLMQMSILSFGLPGFVCIIVVFRNYPLRSLRRYLNYSGRKIQFQRDHLYVQANQFLQLGVGLLQQSIILDTLSSKEVFGYLTCMRIFNSVLNASGVDIQLSLTKGGYQKALDWRQFEYTRMPIGINLFASLLVVAILIFSWGNFYPNYAIPSLPTLLSYILLNTITLLDLNLHFRLLRQKRYIDDFLVLFFYLALLFLFSAVTFTGTMLLLNIFFTFILLSKVSIYLVFDLRKPEHEA